MEHEQKPRERSFIRELIPDWRPTREQALWTVRIVIVFVLLLGILTLIGLPFEITLWEWVKLLIVPAVIAAGGLWFNRQQRDREMEIAERRSQDEALQAYLDGMSQLLTDKDRPLHRAQPGDNLSTVARARTLTVLPRLDGERKGRVVQFLYESGLIAKNHPVLNLRGANLSSVRLSWVKLIGADLREINLHEADLVWTDLGWAILSGADLSQADLVWANLDEADLGWANLRGANLINASFSGAGLLLANFTNADLSNANLSNAYLKHTNFTNADLTNAIGVTNEELEQQAESLEGATMPDGQKYEDWLKDKEGRVEDE